MNEEYILLKARGNLVARDQLSTTRFEELFGHLEEDLQQRVREILDENSIEISDDGSQGSRPSPKRRHLERLSNEQLCILYQRGDVQVLDALCRKNRGFVQSVAKSLRSSYRHKLSIEDLLTLGYMGFIEAVKRFDTTSSYKLISYAVHHIRKEIMAGIAEQGFTVRIPLNVLGGVRSIVKLQAERPNISTNEILDYLEEQNYTSATAERLVRVYNATLHPTSLYEPLEHADGKCLLDRLSTDEESAETTLMRKEFRDFMVNTVKTLDDRGKTVIAYRFGLDGHDEKTLEQIGAMLGLTRERVRQISDNMLVKLAARVKPSLVNFEYGGS
jgi:RNA polymerase sigma factor (sigma-70 family)